MRPPNSGKEVPTKSFRTGERGIRHRLSPRKLSLGDLEQRTTEWNPNASGNILSVAWSDTTDHVRFEWLSGFRRRLDGTLNFCFLV